MKTIVTFFIVLFMSFMCVPRVWAHCEIPCGIYDDGMRISQIAEHIETIEKSMKSIIALSTPEVKNYNQLVRWINNKETHATHIQDIVSQYFMTQRIKPVPEQEATKYGKYIEQLRLLHEMLIYAMKAKQTTDLTHTEKLRSLLTRFSELYFGPGAKELGHHHR